MKRFRFRSLVVVATIGVLFSLHGFRGESGSHPEDSSRLPCSRQPNQKARTGEVRIRFDGCHFAGYLHAPESSARHFLEFYDSVLGLEHGLEDLVVEAIRETGVSAHTRFAQVIDGRPIFESFVLVGQGSDGAIVSLHMNYYPAPEVVSGTDVIGVEAARALAMGASGVTELRMPAREREVWFASPDGSLRLAHEFWVFSADPLGDFLTLVDAATGKILFLENRIAFETGSGKVFWPNPLQTTGQMTFVDGGDSTTAALDAARVSVTLERLDAGTGLLKGQWVDTTLPGGIADASFPNEPSRVYEYDRDDPRFEAVVVYVTIDRAQAYFQSLGFSDSVGAQNGIRDFPSLANAHWFESDNSFYSTGNDAVHFGDGGVDDAEDADIVLHEYGHAVQHDQNSCWGGGEMGAMGEGFGDYLAASFFGDIGDATYQASHAACVGDWDAVAFSSSTPPCLRRVDGGKQYPGDLVGQVHADGEIWSAFLWELRGQVGATTADRLVLQHHFGLPCNATMPDAALGLLQADADLNSGANAAAIRAAACARGILSGSDCQAATSLLLSLAASPSPTVTGAEVTYTATLQNTTAGPLSGIIVSAAVPEGSSFVPDSASDGGSEAGGVVEWPSFGLDAGESVQRSFRVLVTAEGASGFADDMNGDASGWVASRDQGSLDWEHTSADGYGGTSLRSSVPTTPVGAADCVDGKADVFSCSNVDLEYWLPIANNGGGDGNDGWGWTDPSTGTEYYLSGQRNGTYFYDLSTPSAPGYLGSLPTHTSASDWRDIKVIGNYAFIVSEASGHGMQIFDLTELRSVSSPQTFAATAHYSGFGNAHNVVANPDTNFVYAVGTGTCSGGLHMVDVSNPLSPQGVGCFSGDGYTHDAQCVLYAGPDGDYSGREICLAFNEDTIAIVDVTDKSSPALVSNTTYGAAQYTHQGWLTEDQAYVLVNDEMDERNAGNPTRTYVFDVSDLDAPTLSGTYEGPLPAIDHNLYVRGDFVFEANYTSGLRILKAQDLSTGTLCEVASFDTYPDSDSAQFRGAWNAYPFFESGIVVVNAIEGVAIVRPDLVTAQCDGGGGGGGGAQKSWFAADPSGLSDMMLATAEPIVVESGATELEFWGKYDLEDGYDGGVVELSSDGGVTWQDLGSQFLSGGYDAVISTGFNNPIGGRMAFTGGSDGWKKSRIDLSPWVGVSVKVRFRSASDATIGGSGWYVDEVRAGNASLLLGSVTASESGGATVESGEQCDDGNSVENDGCSSSCVACGNSVITAPETCDDGNLVDGDGCTASCRIECPSSPNGACETGFGKGKLLIKETPGREKMLVQWKKGPSLSGTDFGNPLVAGGSVYSLCLYDDADTLVADYVIPRAGDTCAGNDCWKPVGPPPPYPTHQGYSFKDGDGTSDGINKMTLKGPRSASIKIQGKNNSSRGLNDLPTGIAAALRGTVRATAQLNVSDTGACFSLDLGSIKKSDETNFQAQN